MQSIKKVLTVSLSFLLVQSGFAAGKASHVVLMVWDGMRADFVTPETTPTLLARARNGVTFLHHHPVYPSMTEVNATGLATGVYPGESGIIANNEFRPSFNAHEKVETDLLATVRQGDELTGNHYLAFPTVAEILHQHGIRTVVAGTKPVALLHDRAARAEGALGTVVFAGNALPESVGQSLKQELGEFPPVQGGKIQLDKWTRRALTGQLWQKGVPPFSVLWMAEPDYTQHQTGPGSKASLAAIRSSDSNLAEVLKALKQKNVLDSTDVIVVSDHGFSTEIENVDVPAILNSNGFRAFDKFSETGPGEGDIMVVGNGGIFNCYVTGHDSGLVTRLVHFLQSQPYCGVIFSQTPVLGAFPMAESGFNSSYAPDVAVTMHWIPDCNTNGAPGLIYCHGGKLGPGQGQHATLDPTDMHNICFAFGPDFVQGMKDPLPSGNIDIAPTILSILGIEPEKKMSGRVLSEALNFPAPEVRSCVPYHKSAEWKSGNFVWRQYLDWSEVNGVKYFDEGNGGQFSP